MPERLLAVPPAFGPESQAFVGVMAASFDDQSRRLRDRVAGLGVEHLEWQERPGRNTVGMLMAHLAGAEIGWFYVVCGGLSQDDGARVVNERLGIDLASDGGGMPLRADGVHPASLKGRDLEGYLDLLARARSATNELLTTWDDASLDTTVTFGPMTASHRWVLYHILEHFAGTADRSAACCTACEIVECRAYPRNGTSGCSGTPTVLDYSSRTPPWRHSRMHRCGVSLESRTARSPPFG